MRKDLQTITKEQLLGLDWKEHTANPLIEPDWPFYIIADPTFLPPNLTPDKHWHMFAHSRIAIHHFVSQDGIVWERRGGVISLFSLRAFLFKADLNYYLFYEKIARIIPTFQSRIEVRISKDLFSWSSPKVVFESRLDWQRGEVSAGNVGNPCVVETERGYRLYYSAGLVFLKDCWFWEPKYIGVGTSDEITGPYESALNPILGPDLNDPCMNLGAGAIKVVIAENGYIGFQNGIYWDHHANHSGSTIRLLESSDGDHWSQVKREPIIRPGQNWKRSHVYALDIRSVGDKWFLYFNARDAWLFGKERIGLAIGSSPK